MGALGVDVLHAALSNLLQPGGEARLRRDYESIAGRFNVGLLFLLPKAPAGCDELLGDYFQPGDTRPLAVVNTDNRLLASAARKVLEPVLEKWINPCLRGFLPRRSMLKNIIDVDVEAMRVSLTSDAGGLVLFDFKAAFPSLHHEYMFGVLKHLGMPSDWLAYLRCCYIDNCCDMVVAGALHPGFTAHSGIRQGCPLSPLLFAAVVDVLLRRLCRLLPGNLCRAYADDLAVICTNMDEAIPVLHHIFSEFGSMSGLWLNIPKTIFIPLFPAPLAAVRARVASAAPSWGGANVCYQGKYLGFVIGPSSGGSSWAKPLRKYEERVRVWASTNAGSFLSSLAYRIYAFSVLGFVAQLARPPPQWDALEEKMLGKLFTGPAEWLPPYALHQGCSLGLPAAIPDLRIVSLAARFRVLHRESRADGGVYARRRARILTNLESSTRFPDRTFQWREWFA